MTSLLVDLADEFVGNLEAYLFAVAIFVGTLFLAKLAERAVRRSIRARVQDPETQLLVSRMARWTVLVLGALTALNQVPGIDVTSLLAGLGIVGFTIGFALQDIARNFIAGLLLLLRQPFNVGDAVEVGGHAGTVLEITTRDTVIKTWDGVMEIIPNLDVYSNPIINYSELPKRRRTVLVGLGYGENVDRAKELFLQAIRGTEGVLQEPAPEILTEDMGDAALNLAARFWVNQQTHNLFGVHSNVVDAINDVAEQEDIDLPFPTQVVHLEADLPFGTPIG
ncbi:MAG: mechanosensitive ion channel family protein [Anaerolineae bacterium]|jgi:small-conductance mechanosensitive channel